jgi:hypothetical protein
MQDHFDEYYEWDGNVPRKRKRIARDRDRISFPMTAMDHVASAFSPTFADGSPDHTSPHRPGFRFLDTDDPAKLAAQEAYEARRRRMENAWRHTGQRQDEDHTPPPRTRTLDELRAAAEGAYQDRNVRLANGWRRKDAAA